VRETKYHIESDAFICPNSLIAQVIEGMDVVKKIESTPTSPGDRPKADCTITGSGEL
jgi:cyclophilin family peptidyl-prolyl cis-trans isomerase